MRLQAPDNIRLIGNSAEWIVERPGFSDGSLTRLADYGTVQFTHAHAERIGGATMTPADGDTINMTEHGKTVSTATATGETVTCTFVLSDNGASLSQGAVVFKAGEAGGKRTRVQVAQLHATSTASHVISSSAA
jgi:hypothetical protein